MTLEWPEWFMLGWLALFAVVVAISPAWMSRPAAIGRFARTVGLPLDADVELERIIGERLRQRARWGALGSATGAAASALVVASGAMATLDEWGSGLVSFAGLVLVGVILIGRGIGDAISILPAPPEVRRDGPRIARMPRPSVRDYVAPIERVGARILVTFGAVLAVVVAALPIAFESRLLAGAAALGAIAALIAAEWVSSAIVSRPQPAVSEQLLRWDDALRAQTLRDLVSVPLMFGGLSAVTSVTAGFEWAGTLGAVGAIIVNATSVVLLVGLSVVLVFSIAVRPARYYLERLWPQQFAETRPRADDDAMAGSERA